MLSHILTLNLPFQVFLIALLYCRKGTIILMLCDIFCQKASLKSMKNVLANSPKLQTANSQLKIDLQTCLLAEYSILL